MNSRLELPASETTFPTKKPDLMRAGLLAFAALSSGLLGQQAYAAKDAGCEGGGFTVELPGGPVSGLTETTIPASSLGTSFTVRGKFVVFVVDAATLGVRNYTLTGAPNPLDMTGGVPTTIFASKTPDLQGVALNGNLTLELDGPDVLLARSGPGVGMKIQAKDCAQGGVFQMEPERADGLTTDFTHVLADGVFYFDNPNFRNVNLPLCVPPNFNPSCAPVPVTPRVNFANDLSPKFVGRDSTQVATRVSQFGGVSVWRVASGGRMGGVLGEDSVEVAPPSTNCVKNCQAQNRVRGKFPVLGFPFPVPQENRLTPRSP
ncbi:hypothetical protein Pres01_24920 [Metapseudomonas resinovorans]|uniref:hypothetical protein n=1 Tax=Metapseudomonas resinovorans TaxID=53412 RepID=UPI0009842641|nr:hypothetical protein [Pseudomonas resinovorans]GLZ86441.1 hypothetical protein Pres01_24920 [Pseudomonas resinovorans]